MHDTATVTGGVNGFDLPAVSFSLTSDYVDSCDAGAAVANDGMENGAFKSADSAALGAGEYAYHASIAGNDNYIGDDSECEPFEVSAPPAGILTVLKFYDSNGDGTQDPGEDLIDGWLMDIVFDPDGVPDSFTGNTPVEENVDLGDYLILEAKPLGSTTWIPTNNDIPPEESNFVSDPTIEAFSSTRVTVIPGGATAIFGNVCLGEGGGKTPGYWSNKNGERTFEEDGDNVPNNLNLINNLPLVNDDGSPAVFGDYSDFKDWLKTRKATNMAYQLSGHLAAMNLNVVNGLVDGNTLVFSPTLGFVSINDLIADAITTLSNHPYTPTGDPERENQEVIKDALASGNENEGFLQPTIDSCLPLNFPTPVETTETTETP